MFHITLNPLPDQTDPEGTRRLRRVLKFALRSCRLRCVSVVTDEPSVSPGGNSQPEPAPRDAPGTRGRDPVGEVSVPSPPGDGSDREVRQ